MKLNYAQKSNQGCLVVCLSYLFSEDPTRELESEILKAGLFAFRDNYTMGVLTAFLDYIASKNYRAEILVDNKYYRNVLAGQVNHPKVKLNHAKNDQKLLESLQTPFIVYLDINALGTYTHQPHFVLVTGKTAKYFRVFNPWLGKENLIQKQKVYAGINSLRSHIKVCPFVITKKPTQG